MEEHINNLVNEVKIKSLAQRYPVAIEFLMVKNGNFIPLTSLIWQRVYNDFNANNKLLTTEDNFEIRGKTTSPIYGLYFYLLYRNNQQPKLSTYRLQRNYGSIDFYPSSFQIIITINHFASFETQDIYLLLTKIQDTVYIYDYDLRDKVVNKFNSLIGVSSDTISLEAVVQPRNLKLEDIVYGGLVGNKDTPYLVSYKADGFRKFLFIEESGIWLLSPPFNCSWIQPRSLEIASLIQEYKNYIFDGELIPPEKQTQRQDYTLFYVAFDVVTSKSNNYDSRFNSLQHFKVFMDKLHLSSLLVIVKSSILLTTPDVITWPPTQFFFNLMQSLLDPGAVPYRDRMLGLKSQPFKIDGLIFTPQKIAYGPLGRGLKLNERVLTNYPDVCKWKPEDQLTTDLLYRDGKIYARNLKSIPFEFKRGWQPDTSRVTVKEGDMVEFKVDGRNLRFWAINVNTRNTTTKLNEIIESIKRGNGIVYLRYENKKFTVTGGEEAEIIYNFVTPSSTGIWEFRVQNKKLIPLKPRPDKTYPNNKETVIELLRLNEDPILATTLTGEDFRLVRRYFHRVKRQLFDMGTGSLLDLGTGEGGDLTKMKNFSPITTVEPNFNNFQTLKERINNLKLSIQALNVKAEDLQLSRKFNTISLMLSLSFFNQQDLVKLAKVIDDHLEVDGQVLIFTIDGEAVEQSFNPIFTTENRKEYRLGPVHFSLNGNKLEIEWEGTILANVENPELKGKQSEYLFYLDELLKNLPNFKLKDIKRAGGELLLPRDQYSFAQLYSSIVLVKTEMSQYKNLIASKTNQKIPLSSKKAESVVVDPYSQIANNIFKLDTSRYNLIYLIRGQDLIDSFLSGFSDSYSRSSPTERIEMKNQVINYLMENEEDENVRATFQNNVFPLNDGDETKIASVVLADTFGIQIVLMNLVNLEPQVWSTTLDKKNTGPTVVLVNILGQYYLLAIEAKDGFQTVFYPDNQSYFENTLFGSL